MQQQHIEYVVKIPPFFKGRKYRSTGETENFGKFLKAQGINPLSRQLQKIRQVQPDIQLIRQGGEYILKLSTPFKSREIKFKPDVEIHEQRNGTLFSHYFTFEGENTLRYEQKGDVTQTIIYDFNEKGLIVKMTSNDITCTQWYRVA